MARDAQGQVVPSDYRLDGDRITVAVDRGSGDYAYPILLDPVVDWQPWHGDPQHGVYGWFYVTPWPDYFAPSTNGSWGSGLYSVTGSSRYYGSGTWGEWRYPLYGTSFLYEMSFGFQRQQQASAANWPTCMSVGLVNTYGGWDTGAQWLGWNGGSGQNPRTACGSYDWQNPATGVNVCLRSDCTAPASHETNYGMFSQWIYGEGIRDGWNVSHVGGTTAYITDPENPYVQFANAGPPPSWPVAEGESFNFTAYDPGLGVYKVEIDSPSNPGWNRAKTVQNGCTGTNWSKCPPSTTVTDGYGNLPSGDQSIRIRTTDAGGKTSTVTWTAHVYPTSVAYGGPNRSVDTEQERLDLRRAVINAGDAGAADLLSDLTPQDADAMDEWLDARGEIPDIPDDPEPEEGDMPPPPSGASISSEYNCYWAGEPYRGSHRPYPPGVTGAERDYVYGRADFRCDGMDQTKMVTLRVCLQYPTIGISDKVGYYSAKCSHTEEFFGSTLDMTHGVSVLQHCNQGHARRKWRVRAKMKLYSYNPNARPRKMVESVRRSSSVKLDCVGWS